MQNRWVSRGRGWHWSSGAQRLRDDTSGQTLLASFAYDGDDSSCPGDYDLGQLTKLAEAMKSSSYGAYLRRVVDDESQ